jgi:hypothetical protein
VFAAVDLREEGVTRRRHADGYCHNKGIVHLKANPRENTCNVFLKDELIDNTQFYELVSQLKGKPISFIAHLRSIFGVILLSVPCYHISGSFKLCTIEYLSR